MPGGGGGRATPNSTVTKLFLPSQKTLSVVGLVFLPQDAARGLCLGSDGGQTPFVPRLFLCLVGWFRFRVCVPNRFRETKWSVLLCEHGGGFNAAG